MSLEHRMNGLPPAVQQAWDILHNLDVGLKAHDFLSDTVKRILQNLDIFCRSYTDHFIAFANAERERQVSTPPRAGGRSGLKRTVGPQVEFEARLRAAIQAADEEVAAWDLDSMSQSLRESQRERKVKEEKQENDLSTLQPSKTQHATLRHSSPSKRSGEAIESPLTKSFRAIASSSARTRHPLDSSDITSPPTPEPINIDETTEIDQWIPLPSKSEDERYLLVTPQTRYQAVAFHNDVRFHTQWELECALASSGLGYDDMIRDDFAVLSGPVEKAAANIPALLEVILARKTGMLEEPLKVGSSNPGLIRIRREVDREEQELKEDLNKPGLSRRLPVGERPYGGRIAYTIQLDYFNKTSRVNGKTRPRPPDSARWIRPSPIPPISPTATLFSRQSGPTDDTSNPFGVIAKSKPTLPKFLAYLEPPQMLGKSSRIARELGPGRILTIKIPSKASRAELRDLLEGTILIVLGRPFRALFATPDGKRVYAVETNDILPTRFAPRPESRMVVSFQDLLRRFNDLDQKPGQPMAKWGSRLKIYFSDSVPILLVDPSAVIVIPDIISRHASDPDDPTTEETLTDGCGLMSKKVAKEVYLFLTRNGLSPSGGHPSAIQMRFGGSKGMLVIMSEAEELLYPNTDIVLRPSMVKAFGKSTPFPDSAMYTLDLVRWTSLKLGVSLSAEPMPIMVDRGVPKSVFVKLQETVLDELKASFLPIPVEGEDEVDAGRRLRNNVYMLGGVGQEAKKRECKDQGKSLRVAGLTWRDEAEEDTTSVIDDAQALGRISVSDVDPISGQPYAVAEALYNALCAGFHPTLSAYTSNKLRALVKLQAETIVNRFRLPIKQSLSAFIVPDTSGVLAPGEIFIATDEQLLIDPQTNQTSWYLQGPVLALRSPCKLPTDIQKLTAVYKPELAHLRNVIVMSANAEWCRRSPASDLSGGDYDGDTIQLIWDKDLVGSFTNAGEDAILVSEGFVEENFEKKCITGNEVLEGLRGKGEEDKLVNLQHFLLGGLGGDMMTARYSDWHQNAQYTLGVSHKDTVRLGRMSGYVLDACKSGLQVREDVYKEDAKRFGGELEWRCAKKGKSLDAQYAAGELKRPKNLGRYIMDELYAIGQNRVEALLASFPEYSNAPQSRSDYDALSPRILNLSTYLSTHHPPPSEASRQLILLRAHVKTCHTLWEDINGGRTPPDSILDQYKSRLALNLGTISTAPQTPMTPRRSVSVYSAEGVDDETKKLERRIRWGNMRELSRVWRDEIGVVELGALCVMGLGEEWVRELKVSMGVDVVPYKAKQVFIFDMDYTTTCGMRAKSGGERCVTLREEVWTTSRPRRRAINN